MSGPGSDIAAAPSPVFFDTVLQPHRSLPPRGFTMLMALTGVLSVSLGTGFVLLGAWPVCGFFGLDVLLLYVAFRHSYRSARQRETVRLTAADLTVERVSVRGERRHWRFQPYWLRVVFEERDEETNRLVLTSHGRSLVVGSFLAPAERRTLAASLKGALGRWREWVERPAGSS